MSTSAFQPVLEQVAAHPALIDQVHDRLMSAVVDGTLAPGRRLTQDELALMLGVSRQPVSHALQILKRRGLFVDAGKRGVAVSSLDAKHIRDLYQVREALDGLAAGLAARRVASGVASTSERAGVAAIVAHGAKLKSASVGQQIDADVAFHSALYRLSGNEAIAVTVAEQWPHFKRTMAFVLSDKGAHARVWREHAAIVEAIFDGDPKLAERLAREHTSRAGDETARRLLAGCQ